MGFITKTAMFLGKTYLIVFVLGMFGGYYIAGGFDTPSSSTTTITK